MGLCVEVSRFTVGPLFEDGEVNTDVRNQTEVWLVGRRESLEVIKECPTCHRPTIAVYHIMGVAVATGDKTAEEIAVEMCRDETYFIGPVPVNSALPHERCDWPGSYFPLRQSGDPEALTHLPADEPEKKVIVEPLPKHTRPKAKKPKPRRKSTP